MWYVHVEESTKRDGEMHDMRRTQIISWERDGCKIDASRASLQKPSEQCGIAQERDLVLLLVYVEKSRRCCGVYDLWGEAAIREVFYLGGGRPS